MTIAIDKVRYYKHRQAKKAAILLLLIAVTGVNSCDRAKKTAQPNVLLIVLDTTRADRLSLYEHEITTTPFIDEWAKNALVFENCQSVASTTVPSHASMFTGLLPSTHRNNNVHPLLADEHDTLAEILKRSGYRSFLFSANPFISEDNNFDQGFDLAEHPWSKPHLSKSAQIIRSKIDPEDVSSELPLKFKSGKVESWAIKACGEVAEDAMISWLDETDSDKPYFAFINYMEAHRPLLPPRRLREKIMTPAQVARSYATDVSWDRMWGYVFGFSEYGPASREAIRLTYDAAVSELDEHLKSLLTTLQERGDLENTVVIITADHGEHLCDHHFLDHQFSLYQELLKVPMVIWYPKQIEAGRSRAEVSNIDVFPTILELTQVNRPQETILQAESLLHAKSGRIRSSEYLGIPIAIIATGKKHNPNWDPKPFQRELRSILYQDHKLIWSSQGNHELYDLKTDPREQHNIFATEPELANDLINKMRELVDRDDKNATNAAKPKSKGHSKRMDGLGYADPGPGHDDDQDGDHDGDQDE